MLWGDSMMLLGALKQFHPENGGGLLSSGECRGKGTTIVHLLLWQITFPAFYRHQLLTTAVVECGYYSACVTDEQLKLNAAK